MKPIADAIQEVRQVLRLTGIFGCIIDSIVVFLFSMLVFVLIALPWYYSFVPLLVYAPIHTYRNLKTRGLAYAEGTTPELNEQLRTVADNIEKENSVVDELNAEVLHKMKKMQTSSFLSFGRMTRELIFISILSFAIIASSAFNVKFLDFHQTIDDLKKIKPFQEYDLGEEIFYTENETLDDILGNASLGKLGTDQLNLQINPVMSDIDISKVKPPEKREFSQGNTPREISAQTDVAFQETIPKGYQKIVQSYFREISKST